MEMYSQALCIPTFQSLLGTLSRILDSEGNLGSFYIHGAFHLCLRYLSLLGWVLYHRPGSLRVFHSILAVTSTTLFWTEFSDVVPQIRNHSPKCSYRHRDNFDLTFHIFCSSSFRLWYFSSFSYCFLTLPSLGSATSITTTFFWSLSSTTTMSTSIWIWRPHKILAPLISMRCNLPM
ncbi:hypothetical protein XELAEV_18036136mg [Xenopus laevis]|uniref:Uncharacterized protein n=1 Tax=Xenopus laevis TaxID=8355 RepID=A0A974HCS0_XENLA|nr:hypothetical protein XELAEV_18036136mg [Xenopus laevis]